MAQFAPVTLKMAAPVLQFASDRLNLERMLLDRELQRLETTVFKLERQFDCLTPV